MVDGVDGVALVVWVGTSGCGGSGGVLDAVGVGVVAGDFDGCVGGLALAAGRCFQ